MSVVHSPLHPPSLSPRSRDFPSRPSSTPPFFTARSLLSPFGRRAWRLSPWWRASPATRGAAAASMAIADALCTCSPPRPRFLSPKPLPVARGIQETQRLLAEPAPGISASPSEENARYFNVMIIGPTTSPYEGGVYKLELFLPEDYPMAAPKVRSCSNPAGPPRGSARRGLRRRRCRPPRPRSMTE